MADQAEPYAEKVRPSTIAGKFIVEGHPRHHLAAGARDFTSPAARWRNKPLTLIRPNTTTVTGPRICRWTRASSVRRRSTDPYVTTAQRRARELAAHLGLIVYFSPRGSNAIVMCASDGSE